MKSQISSELAILIQILNHPVLEFFYFFGSFQQGGIDFPDSDENHIAKLALEQLSNRDQSRETEAIVATDQNCGGLRIGIALCRFELRDRVQFRQDVRLQLLYRLRNPL